MTAYSTHAWLKFCREQTECYVDPWGVRGHKFPGEAIADENIRCSCGAFTHEEWKRLGARTWNGGVFASAIREWAEARPERMIVSLYEGDHLIRHVRSLAESDVDAVTWVKSGNTDAVAGLAIVQIGGGAHNAKAWIAVNDPKAFFAELVHHFFPVEPITWDASPLAPGAQIASNVVLGENVSVGPNTVIANATIGKNVRIGANCTIGLPGFGFVKRPDGTQYRFPQIGRVLIGDDVEIGSNTCIDRGALGDTIIRDGAKIDNLVHVAHNVLIGKNALVIAGSVLCGGVVIGSESWVAPGVLVREQIVVGKRATLGLGAVVVKDVPSDATVIGNPARPYEPRSL